MALRKSKNNEFNERHPTKDVTFSRQTKFSYHDSRVTREAETVRRAPDPPSMELKKRSKRGPSLSTVITMIIAIAILVEIIWLNTDPKIVIDVPNDAAAQLLIRSSSVYQQAAQKLLGASDSSHTKLTINTAQISAQLEQQFPELGNVSVTLPLIGHQPTIYLDPVTPPAIIYVPQAGYYLVSPSGVALSKLSSEGVAALKLPVITDQNIDEVTVDRAVLVPSDISFVEAIIEQFQAVKLVITQFDIPQATRELDVYMKNVPYYARFNLNDSSDVDQQIGTFLATRQYLMSNHITPSLYVDAEVLGRVYYK
jgi:hypothetical protein